jgi:hypothetical protein
MPSDMLHELLTSELSNCKISKTYVTQYYKINLHFEYLTQTQKHFDFMNSQRESPNKLQSVRLIIKNKIKNGDYGVLDVIVSQLDDPLT